MKLSSPAFKDHELMPAKYTCDGEDIHPPLDIHDIPEGAACLALIMEDPDAPDPAKPLRVWDHWVVWNIPVTEEIGEAGLPAAAVQGKNSWRRNDYGGPCPPIGTHRYFFKLYALDCMLELSMSTTKQGLLAAMQPHIIMQAELIGLYKKQ